MVHFSAEAPSLDLVAGQQTNHAGMGRAQTGVPTEGAASNDEHTAVHAWGPSRIGLKVAPVECDFQHQIETVDRCIRLEPDAEPPP